MPPPNANGNLHIGHGLTIALEDSLTRYYRLRGKSTWYIPGADHAGFETWVVYERNLEAKGHTRFEFDRNELYARVWDFVAEQRGNMELQLRALGASCSWDDLTFTLDENVIDRVYTTFEKMWNDGMIYRGEKLVNYCPKHKTAFADIEVEHQDEKAPSRRLSID
jgi:valyl-tRNA synthetase